MNILKIKDPQGNWVDIPALKGDKGDKGDPGISPTIDSTLSQANQAADAKAVGDKIDEITLTIDETLTQSGQVADAKVTGDALNTKADQNGYYENLNVGVADQLASKNYIEDNEAYTFRPTANGAKVGTREFDTIVGGSIVWNQLVQNGNFTNISMWNTIGTGTIYTVENNIATVNHVGGTSSSFIYQPISCIANHKYFITIDVRSDIGTNAILYWDGGSLTIYNAISSNWRTITHLYNGVGNGINLSIRPNAGEGNTSQLKNFMLFDLTQMFGSEIADYIYNLEQTTPGAGVTWFRKYFPEDYYEYNVGELIHVSDLQSHDTVGFNLFDSDTILKAIGFTRQSDDSFYIAVSSVVVGKTVWKNKTNYSGQICVSYSYKYDSAQSQGARFIFVYTDGTTTDNYASASTSYSDKTIISSANKTVDCIKLTYGTGSTATWLKNICINLSRPGTRDGEYEPHVKHSYPLDSGLTLRGIPKLIDGHLLFDGDIYKPDGTVERRYGSVDLGTLEWFTTNSGAFYSDSLQSVIKKPASSILLANILTTLYVTRDSNGLYGPNSEHVSGDKEIAVNMGGRMYINNFAYTDAASFKVAMSGVYLVYELATPTTETADPYQSLQIADPYGTEEYVTTSLVPVGHKTKYPENLRAKIEGLPWDFANLIAPVETTYIATQNYTAGSLFIINNILYKATANIANGGTITPNTNCTPTTLAEIIAAL